MIFRLHAALEGHLLVRVPFCFRLHHLMFEIEVDESGLCTAVSVGVQVDPEAFRTTMSPSARPGVAVDIVIGGDRAVRASLVEALQRFESHVSFMTSGAVKRVRWDRPKQIWIPETAEEERMVGVFSTQFKPEYPVSQGAVRPDVLVGMAEQSQRLVDLAVLKAFWREGGDEFEHFRYVQAFYDYYFVLEGLYAQGRSSENQVLGAFASNDELHRICAEALANFAHLEDHTSRLQQVLAEEGCSWSTQGLMRLIIRLRGRLHHYSPRSRKAQPTPFEQESFRSVALLVSHMATLAIALREVDLGTALGIVKQHRGGNLRSPGR